MNQKKGMSWVIFLMALLFVPAFRSHAAEKETIYNSPYVSFSEDKAAWTTNAGEASYQWYPDGTTVQTGIASTLEALEKGQHYYKIKRQGELPVGRWRVMWQQASCIHDSYPPPGKPYHGISFSRHICRRPHYSGWYAYCADCGKELTSMFFYMSADAAKSIDYLDMGEGKEYFYLCPYCSNLEQGSQIGVHECMAVSWNSYFVRYDKNTTEPCGGGLPFSRHMYNNETEYEGETVTPITHLTLQNYSCVGYEFVEWNTMPDGSGMAYADGAEIYNLTEKDIMTDGENAIVTLYAQWRPSKSMLLIEPNGGVYEGKAEHFTVEGNYGEAYPLGDRKIMAPAGYAVSFETNGGQKVKEIQGSMHFEEWVMEQPFWGEMIACGTSKEAYLFSAPDGTIDKITAHYEADNIVLPNTSKSGWSFGGWYYDANFTQPAGGAGDKITPAKNLTLYAQWVELVLQSENNYAANSGKGAVDLSWTQADGKDKVYRVYQSKDAQHWTKINSAEDIGNSSAVRIMYADVKLAKQYMVPYTGMYYLTAEGAQGGNFGNYTGGYGGRVFVKVWLTKGELLTLAVGGQNGENGGGTASKYGNGGGCSSILSNQKGLIMIAGGGGGASAKLNGGAGGSSASVIRENNGEDGIAGGGGGYFGGTAGEEVLHHHTQNCLFHEHIGDEKSGGKCYQLPFTSVKTCNYIDQGWRTDNACGIVNCDTCGGSSLGTNHCHWYAHSACGKPLGHYGYTTCAQGHTVHIWGSFLSGSHTYKKTTYSLTCELEEGWNCPYEEGEGITTKQAFGGSNYVKDAVVYEKEKSMGVKEGSGLIRIESNAIGYVEGTEIRGVYATDLAAPQGIQNAEVNSVDAGQVEITWEEPADEGSIYYHYVQSCLKGSDTVLCNSNIVRNELISGVKGYYLLTDENPRTQVDAKNGSFQVERKATAEVNESRHYLHIAAVDVAGNIGETVHLAVGTREDVMWKLYTEQLEIAESENVYPAGRKSTYYVRCDGKTPVMFTLSGYMDGTASRDYQPNYSVYETETGRNTMMTPSDEIREGEFRTNAEGLVYSVSGTSYLSLYPYSYTIRSNRNKELLSVQKFVVEKEASGQQFRIIPRVGAERKGRIIWSEKAKDECNGISIIGDGEAPNIKGMEILKENELIHRPEKTVVLNITAEDDLSGVKDLTVEIVNLNNRMKEQYMPDENGRIKIDITRERPIFGGDFIVTARAVDNVGNENVVTAGTTEFALSSSIERILEPHDPVFKCGESGILTVTTWGYAERIEVEFPEAMVALQPELNQVFDFSQAPEDVREEKIQFMIPLHTPENEKYIITVRAYKGDKRLEDYPSLSTVAVEGNLLDELRTRLR